MIPKNDVKVFLKKITGPFWPKFRKNKQEFDELRTILPTFLQHPFHSGQAGKKVLLVNMGILDAKIEAVYAKVFESLGYEIHILAAYHPDLKKIFNLFGVNQIHYYEDFFKKYSLNKFSKNAHQDFNILSSPKEFLNLRWKNIQIGKYSSSSVMRATRKSGFDTQETETQKHLINALTYSYRAAVVSYDIINKIKPDLCMLIDRGYTPEGELFDACLDQKIPVIQRCGAHKSGYEVLKRYSSPEMSILHHHSLSAESWSYVKNMPWNEQSWKNLYNELASTYESGDWYSEVGTQFNKRLYSRQNLINELNLDAHKKVAVIFPHMFWDATFFWGTDLFNDYYDWFVNVLKIAAQNTRLNWIIKIHPANLVKAKRDNYKGEHVELKAVYDTLGQLPEHIKVIPPESNINTFSLYNIMDYCLTVRGTVGIEASMLGINTLTAGTGRFDGLGFTIDFDNQQKYLNSIRHLEEILPLSSDKIELARRFAYGIFMLRPIHLDLVDYRYLQDNKASIKFVPLFKNRQDFENSKFYTTLRNFIASSKDDYLNI